MKKVDIIRFILVAVVGLLIFAGQSCNPNKKFPVNYEFGLFPDSVINFRYLNSEYDDYNSSGPPLITYRMSLMFSTNRFSKGDQFDLVDYEILLQFNQTDGEFGLFGSQGMYPFYFLTDYARSDENEFGPLTVQISTKDFLTLFASDRTENMEIFVSYWTEDMLTGGSPGDPTPFRLKGVNSPAYDAYPTFTNDLNEMYFSSNRDGNIDIYQTETPGASDLTTWIKLADTTYTAVPVDILNSEVHDVCPYINGNLMVFTSTRAGGFGGYDLYYSIRTGDGWGEPINFGPEINTEHNEFRPIVIYAQLFENDLMIFSSDRPGGMGGYDLYYTGIPRMTIID